MEFRGIADHSSLQRLAKLLCIHSVSLLVVLEPMIDTSSFLEFQQKLVVNLVCLIYQIKFGLFGSWVSMLPQLVIMSISYALQYPMILGVKLHLPTLVHVKCTPVERHCLCLSHIASLIGDRPRVVGGDFNIISSLEEYSGRAPQDLQAIANFNNSILTASYKFRLWVVNIHGLELGLMCAFGSVWIECYVIVAGSVGFLNHQFII